MTQTLMLLPGLLCDESVWAHQCKALADARCIVPSWGSLDSLTDMARHALDEAPAGPLAVAGHSMGGRIALEMMRLAPERIERLALLDTGADPLPPGEAGAQERAYRMALLEVAKQQGMREMGRQWARGMVHPSRVDTPLFERILDMIERKTPAIFAAQLHALLDRPDARPVLGQIRCPTLFLCGRDDTWSPPERHAQMQAAVPAARLEIVETAGHMTTMEQPEVVSRALGAWLRAPECSS